MANPLDYLKDLIPDNTNIFGASPDSNLKQLASMGLLGDEAGYKKALKDANRQSIFQGLLNTGLSYIAQPKTGNYGTILPYVAKAGIAGMGAAQKPFDKLASNAMTNAQLKALLAKQNESIFAKESQSKFTPASVQESIDIKKAGGSDADARAVLLPLPEKKDNSNILKTTNFVQNNKTNAKYPVFFDKSKPIKNRVIIEGKEVPVSQDMFGEDGMSWVNMTTNNKTIANFNQFSTLDNEIGLEENSLRQLNQYVKDVGSLDSGLPKLANQFSESVKAFFNANSDDYTEEELLQRLNEGRMQGLLGQLRLETVGGGVMTEQDAARIVSRLGGDPATMFNNPQVVQRAIGEILANKYYLYKNKVDLYNSQIDSGYGAKGFKRKDYLKINPDSFYGATSPQAIEAESGVQTTTTNTGLPTIEEIEAEQKRRRGGK